MIERRKRVLISDWTTVVKAYRRYALTLIAHTRVSNDNGHVVISLNDIIYNRVTLIFSSVAYTHKLFLFEVSCPDKISLAMSDIRHIGLKILTGCKIIVSISITISLRSKVNFVDSLRLNASAVLKV